MAVLSPISVQHLLVDALQSHGLGQLGLVVAVPAQRIPGQGRALAEGRHLGWGVSRGVCAGPSAQEGLQQRSEWPRSLHSAVHAHKPNRKRETQARNTSTMVTEVTRTVRGRAAEGEACKKMNALVLDPEMSPVSCKATLIQKLPTL